MKTPAQIAKIATIRYIVALILIALLSLSAFWVMSERLEHQVDHANVINLSGRQRMLSQKSYLCASQWLIQKAITETSTSNRAKTDHPLTDRHCHQTIQQFRNGHRWLQQYVAEHDFIPNLSQEIKHLYADPDKLSSQVEQYTWQLEQVLFQHNVALLPTDTQRLELLNALERSVTLLEKDSEQDILDLKWAEFFIFLSILWCLLLEAFLIFSPMVRSLRQEQERLMIARRDAERSSLAKAEFLANMSHEIRTPINGMMGMIQLLNMTPLNAEQQEFTHTLSKSSQALLTLVNDILDFSKLEANKMRFEQTRFSLYELLDDLIDLVFQDAQQRGFDFLVRMAPNIPEFIVGDPTRLRQILLNFLSNAFKFTEKGTVKLDVSLVSSPDGNVILRFLVEDTGKGIAPEKLGTIFNQFEQEDNSTTRRYGGTGLGLAICQQLVAHMGGKIQVSSVLDKGTSFWFDAPFPVIDPSQTLSNHNSLQVQLFPSPLHILLVDPHPITQQYLSELCRAWAMTVRVCNSHQTALDLLTESYQHFRPFDLVLCHHDLPDRSGRELGQCIKSDPMLYPTSVVLMARRYVPSMQEDIKQMGFSGLLVQPISPFLLRQLLMALSHDRDQAQPTDHFYTRLSLRKRHQEWVEYTLTQASAESHSTSVPPQGPIPPLVESNALKRILVVDDTPINLNVLENLLKKMGFAVGTASSGREALQCLKDTTYHLILMDYHMPEMNGIEATRIIRLKHSQDQLPIVALTADTDEQVEQECLRAGMNDFLAKPIAIKPLKACLERCGFSNENKIQSTTNSRSPF